MKVPQGLSWNLSDRFHGRVTLVCRFHEIAGTCLTGSTRFVEAV